MQEIPTKKSFQQAHSTHPALTPKQQLHRYIWICVGLFALFLASFPIAYLRVSNSGEYDSGPLNSFTKEQSQYSESEAEN